MDYLTNAELAQKYRISPFGGINRSNAKRVYVLKMNDDSVYTDYMFKKTLHYTGQGQIGDQTLTRNNKGLANTDWPCHVWWRIPGTKEYEMIGEYFVRDYYWDIQGDRQVIMFRLRKARPVQRQDGAPLLCLIVFIIIMFFYPLSISHVYPRSLGVGSFSESGYLNYTAVFSARG